MVDSFSRILGDYKVGTRPLHVSFIDTFHVRSAASYDRGLSPKPSSKNEADEFSPEDAQTKSHRFNKHILHRSEKPNDTEDDFPEIIPDLSDKKSGRKTSE